MLLMKKYKQLTSEQRYAIYLSLENGDTQRTIASLIGVSPSAVSRELQRNKDKRGGYSWRLAHEMAMERRERLPGNRATPEWIKQKVIRLVRKDWFARANQRTPEKEGEYPGLPRDHLQVDPGGQEGRGRPLQALPSQAQAPQETGGLR